MKRVAIIGFLHESNSFVHTRTTKQHFLDADYHVGEGLISHWEDAFHELGGFIEGCGRNELQIVPVLAASATPAGVVERTSYEDLVSEILGRLAAVLPVDGVLLALHGAMCVEGLDSADGETVTRIRHVVGDGVPIVLTLDMHANVSTPMILMPNATIAYRTYPHVDQRDRGIEASDVLSSIMRGHGSICQSMIKLPMLIHIVRQFTGSDPMKALYAHLESIVKRAGMISASIAPGYIYADVPDMGVSVIAVAKTQELANSGVRELAGNVLSRREELNAALPGPADAVAEAMRREGTVVLMDCGDNIGGGGPGDSTILYREIIRQGAGKACIVLHDPSAAEICALAGVGGTVDLAVGDCCMEEGERVRIRGHVRRMSDGLYVETEPRHGGHRHFNQGRTAVVETEAGHTVVLNSLRVMPTSLQQLLSLSLDPGSYRNIVVKGATAPLAAYAPIADHVIAVDTPGSTQAGPEAFDYRRRPRPLFPLDDLSPGHIVNLSLHRTSDRMESVTR